MATQISFGFLGGNIVTDSDTNASLSCAAYADLCREEIEAAFEGAEVDINWEVNASGSLPRNLVTSVDGETDTADCEAVRAITEKVWEEMAWVVSDAPDEDGHEQEGGQEDTSDEDSEGDVLIIWDDDSGWSLEESSGAVIASGGETSEPEAMRSAGVVVAPGAVRRCSDPNGVIFPVTRY